MDTHSYSRNTAGIQLSLTCQLLVHLSALISDQFDSLFSYFKNHRRTIRTAFQLLLVEVKSMFTISVWDEGKHLHKLENRSNKLQVCLDCTSFLPSHTACYQNAKIHQILNGQHLAAITQTQCSKDHAETLTSTLQKCNIPPKGPRGCQSQHLVPDHQPARSTELQVGEDNQHHKTYSSFAPT